MCGIAGIFAYRDDAPAVSRAELLAIRESMTRRGPDGAGEWSSADGRVGLAHRRLAIIDLGESGAQPMATADGRLHITFNGEIYNYAELRRELEAKGYAFRSHSDTEVLLHLYADRGERMFEALRGMYAFGIWDAQRGEMLLARDPFGIKPLYFADDGDTLRFASQVKALLKGGHVDASPEPAGSVGFLVWGYVPEPYTLHRGIRALPAGSWMRVRRAGHHESRRFFDVREEFQQAQEKAASATARSKPGLREALHETVRHHLVADIPVAVFLSAGIDSSTIAGIAAECSGATLRAVTLGFDEFRGTRLDEVPLAQETAERLGLEHSTAFVTRDDFESELHTILEAMDQPTTDGVNTYFVSRAAARAGIKVALSGLGGDELFGGYPSYWQVPRTAEWLGFARAVPRAGRMARWMLAPLLRRITSPKYASVLEYGNSIAGAYLLRRALFMPWEADAVLDPSTVKAGLEELRILQRLETTIAGLKGKRTRIAALELSWYMRNQLLRDADWAGMVHSVEIRVPLIDVPLLRALAPMLLAEPFPGKADLAAASPRALPPPLLARRKTGFVTPLREWMMARSGESGARGLRSWARYVLPTQPRMIRALVLVTDAFGGNGGIAKFNRDLIRSIAALPECAEVVVVPRVISAPLEAIPERVRFVAQGAGGKMRFVRTALREGFAGPIDVVIAGHINLSPLSVAISRLKAARSLLVVHGIDAWTPHKSALTRAALSSFATVVAVSRLTMERFRTWSGLDAARFRLLPNCVDPRRFAPEDKSPQLARELGVDGRTVIMTLGRLASEERYKGFDQVIEALPHLLQRVPDLVYLVCGDGPDRARLEAKAKATGVASRVIFTGFVPEERKVEYYNLADAYVMPSNGEGFGIVFLEALACGIPVLGSNTDGGREALLDGELGCLVNPADPEQVREGVLSTLARRRGEVPAGLARFFYPQFSHRAQLILRESLELAT
jgi:asparagine synthase (glutamine-hydrolysing)